MGEPKMAIDKLSLTLKNRLRDLDKLNQAIAHLCPKIGISKKCQCETSLVLEELFTNIIHHGYPDGGDHSVRITISVDEQELTLKIEDDGVPFNPLAVAGPDCTSPIEDREIGGLGVLLARHFSKEIQYRRQGKKNVLTLKKCLN
jgi:anti-sigma regulatory factor (Ser/Thr protein kinase)